MAFGALPVLFSVAGCGNTYRPVVSSINPVGPAGQPTKYAVAISAPSATAPGLVTLIDFSGDTIVNTTAIGANPYYLILNPGGSQGYTLNGDGTVNTFAVSSNLLASDVLQSTLIAGSRPVSIYPQGTYTYIAESGRNAVGEFQGTPPALQQELPTGAGSNFVVGTSNSPRAYALVAGNGTTPGTAVGIETGSNTLSTNIPVGINPTYGVMTSDSARAFVLNKGSNTVSVISSQTNALDVFRTSAGVTGGTIPVGVAPVWADFAPTLTELLVLNQGNGTTAGSVSVINIPRCEPTATVTNPNCNQAAGTDPLDATGFGDVLATIPVGVNPVMIGVLQDGTQAYVANSGNPALPCALPAAGQAPNCSVSVINLLTNTVIQTIPFIASTDPNDAYGHGRPAYLGATTGTPTGKVYVTALDSTDITIIRTDLDVVRTHLSLQGNGVSVRVSAQ